MPAQPFGDCFVLANARGEWWTGEGWARDLRLARRYDQEPDPHGQARLAAARVRAATGAACIRYYLGADQARRLFRGAASLNRAG